MGKKKCDKTYLENTRKQMTKHLKVTCKITLSSIVFNH